MRNFLAFLRVRRCAGSLFKADDGAIFILDITGRRVSKTLFAGHSTGLSKLNVVNCVSMGFVTFFFATLNFRKRSKMSKDAEGIKGLILDGRR